MGEYVTLFIYVFSVLVSLYALDAFQFESFMKKNRTAQIGVFYIISSLALGYLVAQCMIVIANIRL